MGKKKNKKKRRRNGSGNQPPELSREEAFPEGGLSWMEGDGLHAVLPGKKPSQQQIEKMTENYQRQLRKSPMFKQWVKQYGKQKALEMLKECRVELR